MPKPAGNISTANLDGGQDSPAAARVQLLELMKQFNLAVDFLLPTGTVIDFAGGNVPDGFLECDGSEKSRAKYADLYNAIGTAFGAGDGSTTFNVPDCRRRVSVGKGGVAVGGPGNALGDTGGAETHVLTEAEMPSHDHDVWTLSSGSSGRYLGQGSNNSAWRAATSTGRAGGGRAHNIMQPSIVFGKLIKT